MPAPTTVIGRCTMKRFVLILCVLMMLCLWGCGKELVLVDSNDDAYFIDTEYFTLTLPPDLQGKCEHKIETFDDGTYELVLYQKEGLKDSTEIFNIRLFPLQEAAEGYFIGHGILTTPKGDYELYSRLPEGVENTEDDNEIAKYFYGIATDLMPKNGCEILVPQLEAPADEVQDIVIETAYYTLTVPVDFYNNCECQIFAADEEGPDGLVMYELSSFKTDYGGHLFTILLIPHGEDYSYYPSYEWVGVLETPEGDFDIVVLYPTDVQFSEDTAEAYHALLNQTDDVIFSLHPKDGIGLVLP